MKEPAVPAEGDATVVRPARSGVPSPSSGLSRPHVLEMVKGPGAPARFELTADEVVIGRSSEADLRIEDQTLSRRHARLVRVHDAYRCSDEESRNGLFLNGLEIQSATLRNGDRIQIGGVVLVYHEGS